MKILAHVENQINYYEQELKRQEKIENPRENDKSYIVFLKILIKVLKVEERKLLKVK